jgi:hypothetical protein
MTTVQQRNPSSPARAGAATPIEEFAETRTLTAAQVRAIRTVMQIFVEEDLAFGTRRSAPRWCARCEAERPGAGSIDYDCGSFCNPCATEYELARARGMVHTPREFLLGEGRFKSGARGKRIATHVKS